jgi:hypothetical protein
MDLQLKELFPGFNKLQIKYGNKALMPIYGAGCIKNPKLLFVFMNPTGKNVSSTKNWSGIRAPWLGTKNIWKLFVELNLINERLFYLTQSLKPQEWTPKICHEIYTEIASNKSYVTNLAKCTQVDARSLSNNVFRGYLRLIEREITIIQPRKIIAFGNQVSTMLLNKRISVSKHNGQVQLYATKNGLFNVYPVYYPVGQGLRNMRKAVDTIAEILKDRE